MSQKVTVEIIVEVNYSNYKFISTKFFQHLLNQSFYHKTHTVLNTLSQEQFGALCKWNLSTAEFMEGKLLQKHFSVKIMYI